MAHRKIRNGKLIISLKNTRLLPNAQKRKEQEILQFFRILTIDFIQQCMKKCDEPKFGWVCDFSEEIQLPRKYHLFQNANTSFFREAKELFEAQDFSVQQTRSKDNCLVWTIQSIKKAT